MKAYNNSVTLRNDGVDPSTYEKDLNAGIGINVTVRVASTPVAGLGATASIFDIADVPLANPMSTDNQGNYTFKVTDGLYDIIIAEGTADEVILSSVEIVELITPDFINNLSLPYVFDDIPSALGSPLLIAGKTLYLKNYSAGDRDSSHWNVVDLATVTISSKYTLQHDTLPLALVSKNEGSYGEIIKRRYKFKNKPEIIAHQGFRQVNVQNTIYGLKNALLDGADSVECDVQNSVDGTPWLYHDINVSPQTNGEGVFVTLTDSYIETLRYVEADGTNLEGVGLAKLSDIIEVLRGHDGGFYPEIKGTTDYTAMVTAVKDAGLSNRTMWQGFELSNLVGALAIDPIAEYGYLIGGGGLSVMTNAVDAVENLNGVFSILSNFDNVLNNPSIVDYARSRGVDVAVYTVDDRDDYEQLINLGVYRIMTNRNYK
tara:strand:- start:30511 stop:31800 length:1290 start_codon:yes stop_codon:yes gene_type:complete